MRFPAATASGSPDSVPADTRDQRRDLVHDVARPPYAASGNPPPTIFPSVVKIRLDPVKLLGAARSDAKSRHHFVDDQQRRRTSSSDRAGAVRIQAPAERSHVATTGSTITAAISTAMFGERFLHRHGVIERQRNRGLREAAGTPAVSEIPSVARPDPASTNSEST